MTWPSICWGNVDWGDTAAFGAAGAAVAGVVLTGIWNRRKSIEEANIRLANSKEQRLNRIMDAASSLLRISENLSIKLGEAFRNEQIRDVQDTTDRFHAARAQIPDFDILAADFYVAKERLLVELKASDIELEGLSDLIQEELGVYSKDQFFTAREYARQIFKKLAPFIADERQSIRKLMGDTSP